MTNPTPLALDVVIDVVCPWCWIGKRRLDAARDLVPDLDITVSYRPFQLDGTIPAAGVDRAAYMLGKFGNPARIAQIHADLTALGADLGIPFAFDRITVSPNTFDAHRLMRWAGAAGFGDLAAETLFRLYFVDGADIGRAETLIRAATEIGLDPNEVAMKLTAGTDADMVREEIDYAGRLGITGVPCTIVAGKFAISGAQKPESFAEAFRQVSSQLAEAV